MTLDMYNLDGFFGNTLLNFDYNEMYTLSPILETDELLDMVSVLLELVDSEEDDGGFIFDEEPRTPPPSFVNVLDLSFEGDRLPIFIDECDENLIRPVPTFGTLEMRNFVR